MYFLANYWMCYEHKSLITIYVFLHPFGLKFRAMGFVEKYPGRADFFGTFSQGNTFRRIFPACQECVTFWLLNDLKTDLARKLGEWERKHVFMDKDCFFNRQAQY